MSDILSLFNLFALAACLGAVAVVVSQSVVRMAFWLVVSLGSVAGLFFLADADFIGAAQLLIYVGGTLVLLVFGVMLTASGPYMKIETTRPRPMDSLLPATLRMCWVRSSSFQKQHSLCLCRSGFAGHCLV